MNKIIRKINIEQSERFIFWFLLVALVISSVFYAYFINQTILNIVERENVGNEIVTLGSEISGLEFEYISLKNEVDLDYAHSVGFVDVNSVKFASRKIPTPSLSLRGGE